MRIAIAINTAWNIANFRSGLIMALIKEGHEVLAIAPSDQFVGDIESLGAKFCPISMENHGINPLKDLFLILNYFNLFRKEKIDCLPIIIFSKTVKLSAKVKC